MKQMHYSLDPLHVVTSFMANHGYLGCSYIIMKSYFKQKV